MAQATAAYQVHEPLPQSGIQGFASPWDLAGQGTPDGDLGIFMDAPLGSTYRDVTNGNQYLKTAENDADADWVKMIQYEAWMDMVEAGAGVPDGTDSLVKGSVYLQTDAVDDAVALFVKVDDAGDAGDWKSVSYTA